MDIRIAEVNTRRLLRIFINLPAQIHAGHANWVPPIYLDDRSYFNHKRNKLFRHCDTVMLLAYRESKPAGRIMGIINHRYNETSGERDARFCFMETWEDREVFHALIEAIENWARSQGCQNLVGPLGFNDKDPQGFLIEGFDQPVVLSTNCNFPYMPALIQQEGYEKKVDCVVYKIPIPESTPDFYRAIATRTMKNNNLKIIEFTSRGQIRPMIRPVLNLLNETFRGIYAFDPFEEWEMDDFARRFLLLLDPKYIKVISDIQGNIIAFIVAMPDISEGIRACRGRLIPFGIFQIIRARKRTQQLNLLLGGIKEAYRGKGLDVLMGMKILEAARKRGMRYMDSHLELETNTLVRREMERMGGEVYKRFRIFTKAL
jgi:GNAT superfamily N-acetyltransferase